MPGHFSKVNWPFDEHPKKSEFLYAVHRLGTDKGEAPQAFLRFVGHIALVRM